MLKDFAKTSPVTFFALPIIIIGMLVLSYFLYSTLINNQVESREQYLNKQLALSIDQLNNQVSDFKEEVPTLADLDDFSQIFGSDSITSGKLRLRLRRAVQRFASFIDTVYLYDQEQFYGIGVNSKGVIKERFGTLDNSNLPLQFISKAKIIHLHSSKLLLMTPLNESEEHPLYIGGVIDVIEMINKEASAQFIGEHSAKVIFTENLGFKTIQKGSTYDGTFKLFKSNKQKIINDLLESNIGYLIHRIPHSPKVFLTTYRPFSIFEQRFGLLFSVSEDDFVGPIKLKLQVIFLSFFIMIGVILVVFVTSLKDITLKTEELSLSKEALSRGLDQQRLLLEYGDTFSYTIDKNGAVSYVSDNLESITSYASDEWANHRHEYLAKTRSNEKINTLINTKSGEKSFELSYSIEFVKKDGKHLVLEFRERPFFNEESVFESMVGVAKDVTLSRSRRNELKRALSILKFQQEASIDGILVTDENFNVVSSNAQLLKLFSLKEQPIEGVSALPILDEICTFGKDDCIVSVKSRVLDNARIELREELELKDGRFYDLYSAPIKENEQVLFGRIWTFRDITERKKEVEQLKIANEKAREGAIEKENFLSTMSHEIRTPLNSIVGFANLLLQENPREDQKEQIVPLKYSADSLLGLINDILDLTKIESGNIHFEKIPFNPNEKMSRAQKVFSQNAREHNVDIQLTLDDHIPEYVLGDYNRLNQIIYNLMSNAIKFTERGTVELGTKLKSNTETTALIQFWVKDTGIGIAEENHEHIFESFTQADSNTTREFGGTGLGLAITKKLVELQGGKIELISALNEGSTFFFELEFEKTSSHLEQDEEPSITAVSSDLKGLKVLVVEDNPFNQKVVEKFLSKWHATITLASSGEEALEVIKTKAFDTVLMDLQMPGMDGYETARSIRTMSDPYFKTLHIIAMSADALGDVKEKVAIAGMNGYISKPFDPNQLLDLLAGLSRPSA